MLRPLQAQGPTHSRSLPSLHSGGRRRHGALSPARFGTLRKLRLHTNRGRQFSVENWQRTGLFAQVNRHVPQFPASKLAQINQA